MEQQDAVLRHALAEWRLRPDNVISLDGVRGHAIDSLAVMLQRLHGLLDTERPDISLVQSDTLTTLGASLAATYGACEWRTSRQV